MAVNQTLTQLTPEEVAAITTAIVEGDINDGTDSGIRRIVEQMNWSAGKRPEQHCCFLFGDDNFDGGNEIHTVPMPFPDIGNNEVTINFDMIMRPDFSHLALGVEGTLQPLGQVTINFLFTDESANTWSPTITINALGPGDGNEQRVAHDITATNLIRGQWWHVQVELETIAVNGSDFRMLRVADVAKTSAYPLPEDS